MRKNIFLSVEYVGSRYFGFQLQNKKDVRQITVQEVIEEALHKLFKQKIRITYSSRTDRGVHARAQAVNFCVDSAITPKNIKNALNAFLPRDVRVTRAKKVPLEFHSRFWAKAKIYRYLIRNAKEPSVFWEDFSWQIADRLDIAAMKKAARALVGKRDFSIFGKETKNYAHCVREIKNVSLRRRNSLVVIDIEADGFLRNMARNIVSFLVKVGCGRLTLAQAEAILNGKSSYTNKPAPAQGLCLTKVSYSIPEDSQAQGRD